MDQREKELQEIVQVSAQIKDMTITMKKDVEVQGVQLDHVESTTDIVKEEVIAAETNIVEAEKDEQSTGRTLWILGGAIIAMIIFIVLLLFILL